MAAARPLTQTTSPDTGSIPVQGPPAVHEAQGVLLPALVPPAPPPAPLVLVAVGRWDWERVIRRAPKAQLPSLTKLVALMAATYGDPDGSRVRPGERALAEDCGIGQSTARKHLATLVAVGLLERVQRGGGPNRLADEYRLVAPEGTPLAGERRTKSTGRKNSAR